MQKAHESVEADANFPRDPLLNTSCQALDRLENFFSIADHDFWAGIYVQVGHDLSAGTDDRGDKPGLNALAHKILPDSLGVPQVREIQGSCQRLTQDC